MLTREQKLVRRWLRARAAEWAAAHAGEGFVYDGPFGFVLEHGEWFAPRALPPQYQGGAPKKCFGNSIALAAMHGIDYVEGYAVDPGTDRAVFAHAWNADDSGLVDSTWCRHVAIVLGPHPTFLRGMAGAAYLGVRFAVERADDATWNGNRCVLDDSERGWPLLRQRWEGEPTDPVEYTGTAERLSIYRPGLTGSERRAIFERMEREAYG